MAPPNARYCKVYRKKSKSATPPEVLKFKNKIINSKKKANELTRRLTDKDYDDKILQKNRDRVKRSRDKKKAEANKPSNEGPTLSDEILSQEDTNKENTSKEVTNKEDSNTSAPPVGTSRVLKKGRRRILADTSLDSLSDDDSSSSPFSDNSGCAGDSFSPMIVKLPFSTPFRTKQQESGIKRRRETLRGKKSIYR